MTIEFRSFSDTPVRALRSSLLESIMMSANCSVVITGFNVFESSKSQARCHANASRRVFLQTSSHGVSLFFKKSPQELTRTNSCRVKFPFTTAHRCRFLRSRPTSHARSSKHQQTTTSRPPLHVEVGPRSITPANHFRQLFLGVEPIPDACLVFLECSARLASAVAIARVFAA